MSSPNNNNNNNQSSNDSRHLQSRSVSNRTSRSSTTTGSSGFSSSTTTTTNSGIQADTSFYQNPINNQTFMLSDKGSSSSSHKSHLPSPLKCFLNALTRKKPLDCRTETNFNRCLSALDLTALGVGSTLGLGLYVLAGQVASNKAGPAVVFSFGFAALASAFSALCYAEFAGRVPRAGSAYAYSYITVGEFVAFIIGWNLILEYVIGCSSVARGFSGYLQFVFMHLLNALGHNDNNNNTNHIVGFDGQDEISKLIGNCSNFNYSNNNNFNISLQNNSTAKATTILILNSTLPGGLATNSTITNSTSAFEPIIDYLVKYFDWPSLVIIFIVTMFVLFGVKESTNFTMLFTSLNLFVVLIVVGASLNYLNIHNWQLEQNEIPCGYGVGGFLPYGWSGVLAGSGTCFFGFIGFDTIASSAEEAKNPKKTVPLSIILSLFISFLAYMAIAIVQTLLWPYYDQDKITILPYIFDQLQMPIIYWIVLLGAIAGLASSQLGGLYPLPRILYSMANDRLIYTYLAQINKKLKLPVRATIIGSIFIALLSCTLDIQDLADMVSIGTLAAYSLVSISVLILRYEIRNDELNDSDDDNNNNNITPTNKQQFIPLTFNDILKEHDQDKKVEDITEFKIPDQSTIDSIFSLQYSCDTTATFPRGETLCLENETSFHTKEEQTTKSTSGLSIKQKLSQKPSTPIRTKGSRPLLPQLSVGFNSWFKNQPDQQVVVSNDNLKLQSSIIIDSGSKFKREYGYLDLLLNWNLFGNQNNYINFKQLLQEPSERSSKLSKILIFIIVMLSIIINLMALITINPPEWLHHLLNSYHNDNNNHIFNINSIFISIIIVLFLSLFIVMIMLSRLPNGKHSNKSNSCDNDDDGNEMFQVPWVPLIPTLSILVNTMLMLNLSYLTWIRFSVWMAIGLFIYFSYGIWNSEGYLSYLDRKN